MLKILLLVYLISMVITFILFLIYDLSDEGRKEESSNSYDQNIYNGFKILVIFLPILNSSFVLKFIYNLFKQ